MATIRPDISLLARWRPYRLPLASAVFNSAERFGVVRELTVLFCANFSCRSEHEDDHEHEGETLVADLDVSSVELLSRTLCRIVLLSGDFDAVGDDSQAVIWVSF